MVVVGSRIKLLQSLGNRLELGIRPLQAHARFQSAFHQQSPIVAGFQKVVFGIRGQPRRHVQRDEEGQAEVLIHPGEVLRGHADYGEVQAVEPHGLADCRAVAGELLHPEIVAQNHHCVAPGHLIFVRPEAAPQSRLHSHCLEEVA